jgi:hypothetical protein
MSDYKSVKQLCEENPNINNHILSLTDVIAKLEVINIDLANKNIKLQNELNEYSKCTVRCSPPSKTYKELEDKLALAENSKQTAIDDLYETKIGPLQNKVKDQHIQLESQYKRETKLQQQIKELETLVKDQQTIIHYAAGYISACEQFRDKHPTDVVKWLFEGLK